jgi:hypothetical protein
MEGLLTEFNQCKQIRDNLSQLKTEFSDMEIRGIHRDMRLKILTSMNIRLRAELRRIIQTNDLLKDKLRELAIRLGEIKEERSGKCIRELAIRLGQIKEERSGKGIWELAIRLGEIKEERLYPLADPELKSWSGSEIRSPLLR